MTTLGEQSRKPVGASTSHQMGDLSEVVGKSKELVETVARVVILSTEGTVNESWTFSRP